MEVPSHCSCQHASLRCRCITCRSLRKLCGVRRRPSTAASRAEQAEALETGGLRAGGDDGAARRLPHDEHANLGRARCSGLTRQIALALGLLQVGQSSRKCAPTVRRSSSATLSPRLEAAAGSWLKAPMRIYAEGGGGRTAASESDEDDESVDEGMQPATTREDRRRQQEQQRKEEEGAGGGVLDENSVPSQRALSSDSCYAMRRRAR